MIVQFIKEIINEIKDLINIPFEDSEEYYEEIDYNTGEIIERKKNVK